MNNSTTDYKKSDEKGNSFVYYLNNKKQKIKVSNFQLECVDVTTDETQNLVYTYKVTPKPIIKPYEINLPSNKEVTQKTITKILGINYQIYNIKEFTNYLAQKTNEYIYKNLDETSAKGKDYKITKEIDIKVAKDFIEKLYNLINDKEKIKEYITLDNYDTKYIGFIERVTQLEDELIVISTIKMLQVLYKDNKGVQNIKYLSSLYRGLKHLKVAKLNGNRSIKYNIKYYDEIQKKYTSIKMIKLYKGKIIQIVDDTTISPKYYANYLKEFEKYINSISKIPVNLQINIMSEKSTIENESIVDNSLIFIEDSITDRTEKEEVIERIENDIEDNLYYRISDIKKILNTILELDRTERVKKTEILFFKQNNFINEPTIWSNYNRGNYILPTDITDYSDFDPFEHCVFDTEYKYTNENEKDFQNVILKNYIANLYSNESEYEKINYYQWLNLIYEDIKNTNRKDILNTNIIGSIKELQKRELKLKEKKPIHIRLIKACNQMVKKNLINAITEIREKLKIRKGLQGIEKLTTTQIRYILDIYTMNYKAMKSLNKNSDIEEFQNTYNYKYIRYKEVNKLDFEDEFTFLNENKIIKKCIE